MAVLHLQLQGTPGLWPATASHDLQASWKHDPAKLNGGVLAATQLASRIVGPEPAKERQVCRVVEYDNLNTLVPSWSAVYMHCWQCLVFGMRAPMMLVPYFTNSQADTNAPRALCAAWMQATL